MIPNLFIVGAPKCGTTAWYHYLRRHPDIFFPELKEPNYFALDFPRVRAVTDIEAYLALFGLGESRKIVGDASATYLYSEEAAAAIHRHNPDAKIIIFVRDQAQYLPSWHSQLLYNGTENIADFETAWRQSGRREGANLPPFFREKKFLDYKSIGTFSPQIERYRALFRDDQIRIFHFDDWTADVRQTYLQILSFLGVEDDGFDAFPVVNEAKHHRNSHLVSWLRRPPAPVRTGVSLLKKLLGRSSLGIADRIVRLNTKPGMAKPISEALAQEIRDFYNEDNARLDSYLGREVQSGS
jgi:hypothetical protein